MSVEPGATSTPTAVPRLVGRKAIRDHNSLQSPIEVESPGHQYETRSRTTLERSYESPSRRSPRQSPNNSPRGERDLRQIPESYRAESHDTTESDQISDDEGLSSDEVESKTRPQDKKSEYTGAVLGIMAVGLIALFLGLYLVSPLETSSTYLHDSFSSLEETFNRQGEDFWRHIRVSIKEIPVLDQPRTIILLYNKKAENTLEKILQGISNIAVCKLSQCSNKPVIIEGASLNTSELINDYGKIISKYRDKLGKSGMMIVKNLEKVPGGSAQAFHSFCDDYNPVVKKALILFTMKVEKLPEGYPMKFVEQFLLNLWSDIGKDDKFYPLFTRISGIILSVKPE